MSTFCSRYNLRLFNLCLELRLIVLETVIVIVFVSVHETAENTGNFLFIIIIIKLCQPPKYLLWLLLEVYRIIEQN